MAKTVEIGPYSAYALAVAAGFVGTEEEWLKSLIGPQGEQGASITDVKINGEGHIIVTVHDPVSGEDSTIDAGDIGTVEAVEGVNAAIRQAAEQAVAAVTAQQATSVGAVQAAQSTGVQAVQQAQSTATGVVGDAQTSAVQAVNSARDEALSQVETSTEAAEQAKDAAASSAAAAAGSATDAAASKTAAATSATQAAEAKTGADSAKAAAETAQQAAESAKDSAEVAQSKAEQAETNAQSAAGEIDAGLIVESASGEVISVSDSANAKLRGLRLYGKSVQDGTPTPEAPVEIESAGDSGSITVTLSDGAEESQTLTYPTPSGLPGIPVESGGNYTDVDGQQWICDEVDFGRGKYVQRVKSVDYDGSTDESWSTQTTNASGAYRFYINPGDAKSFAIAVVGHVLCDRFPAVRSDKSGTYGRVQGISIDSSGRILFYSDTVNDTVENWKSWLQSNPVSVIYELATLVETDLSSEQLTAYAALTTYKPNTTITTDSDPAAGIDVDYVADTKTYIDNKLAAISEVILGGTTNGNV